MPGRPLWRPPGCACRGWSSWPSSWPCPSSALGAAPAFQRRTRMTSTALSPSCFRRPTSSWAWTCWTWMGHCASAPAPRHGIAAPPRPRQQSVIHVSLDELAHRGGPADYQPLPAVDVPMLVRSDVALPFLLDECRRQLQGSVRNRVDRRRQLVSRTAGRACEPVRRHGWCRLAWRERVSPRRG